MDRRAALTSRCTRADASGSRSLLALFAGGFGILVGISGFGLERLLRLERRRLTAELGAIFLFAGGVTMNVMLIVRQTLVGYFADYRNDVSEESTLVMIRWVERGMLRSRDWARGIVADG